MDGVVREIYVNVLGKVLELQSVYGGRFEINQRLFADDTALVAEPEEKLCRLVSEFGRVCERRKLRVNVGKSKVIKCSRYGKWKWGSNACDTKQRTVRGSGLFQVPGMASGS